MTSTDDYLQSILASAAKLTKVADLGEYAVELSEIDEALADLADAVRAVRS